MNTTLRTNILRYGTREDSYPVEQMAAGPLSAEFAQRDGFLRSITLGGREVIRAIYVAVRDKSWGTPRPNIRVIERTIGADSFRIVYRSECRENPIAFDWTGAIIGSSDGRIIYRFEGTAGSTFRSNRIGFCLLHPIEGVSGKPCTAIHSDETLELCSFPRLISPHQPFKLLSGIITPVAAGLLCSVSFQGDIFETEDQRNWTDASFKTYSRPLELPFPFTVRSGTKFTQEIRVEVMRGRIDDATSRTPWRSDAGSQSGARATASRTGRAAEEIASIPFELPARPRKMPAIGFRIDADQMLAMEAEGIEREVAETLRPEILRVDVAPSIAGWKKSLASADQLATHLGSRLQVTLYTAADARTDIQKFLVESAGMTSVRVLFIVSLTGRATPDAAIAEARRQIEAASYPRRGRSLQRIALAGGADTDFVTLNRLRPDCEGAAEVAWAFCPQVHAFDNRSILETLEGQRHTFSAARAIYPGKRLSIAATGLNHHPTPRRARRPAVRAVTAPSPDDDHAADARYVSLAGAVYFFGTIVSACQSGASTVILDGIAGVRGLMMGPRGARIVDRSTGLRLEDLESCAPEPESRAGAADSRSDAAQSQPGAKGPSPATAGGSPVGGEYAAFARTPLWHLLAALREYSPKRATPIVEGSRGQLVGLRFATGAGSQRAVVANCSDAPLRVTVAPPAAGGGTRRVPQLRAVVAVADETRGELLLAKRRTGRVDLGPYEFAVLDWPSD